MPEYLSGQDTGGIWHQTRQKPIRGCKDKDTDKSDATHQSAYSPEFDHSGTDWARYSFKEMK